jgi:hypothetical protein
MKIPKEIAKMVHFARSAAALITRVDFVPKLLVSGATRKDINLSIAKNAKILTQPPEISNNQ